MSDKKEKKTKKDKKDLRKTSSKRRKETQEEEEITQEFIDMDPQTDFIDDNSSMQFVKPDYRTDFSGADNNIENMLKQEEKTINLLFDPNIEKKSIQRLENFDLPVRSFDKMVPKGMKNEDTIKIHPWEEVTEMERDITQRPDYFVFLCNNHGTAGSLRPATVIVATDIEDAQKLLETKLFELGYPGFNQKKYRIHNFDYMKQNATILTMEELQDSMITAYASNNNQNKVWICSNHDTFEPFAASSIVSAPTTNEAIRILDKKLEEMELQKYEKKIYTLKELDTTIPKVYILYHGSLSPK